MGVLYEVFVVEIESLQIRLHWSSSRRKMEALPPAPKFPSLILTSSIKYLTPHPPGNLGIHEINALLKGEATQLSSLAS
jgi:hypothetical protein